MDERRSLMLSLILSSDSKDVDGWRHVKTTCSGGSSLRPGDSIVARWLEVGMVTLSVTVLMESVKGWNAWRNAVRVFLEQTLAC